jgi:predicted acetyltransferase
MVEFRTLREEEYGQWLEHCTYVFTQKNQMTYDEMRSYFDRHIQNDPWKNFDNIFVAVERGVILSTLKYIDRDVLINGKFVKAGGIAEVSTKPDHQGEGLSSKLLKLAIKSMEDNGYKMSVLSAGIPDYYRKFGWEHIFTNRKLVKIPTSSNSSFSVRVVDLSKDLDDIINIYESYSYKFNGVFARNSREYWEKWFVEEATDALVACDESGRIIGYMCAKAIFEDEENEWILIASEYGCLENYENAIETILYEYGKIMPEKYSKILKAIVPSLVSTSDELLISEANVGKKMVRLISPFNVGEISVKTTEDLISTLSGTSEGSSVSKYLIWGTDSF